MTNDDDQTDVNRRHRALTEVITAYGGTTYRLLRDLGDHIGASFAYVDRMTIEAHLERTLSDAEWAATNEQFTALAFDDHVGDRGTLRTDWIETVLQRAGVPGDGRTANDAAISDTAHHQGSTDHEQHAFRRAR